jgi:hypothetical protein
MATVLICGDSWSAGTWNSGHEDPNPNQGVGYHLAQAGFQVRNLSKPGGSNLESVQRLRDYLRCNSHETHDIVMILFWTTEFSRETNFYHNQDSSGPTLGQELAVGYQILRDHWIYRPYHRLSEISQLYQKPIGIVGGCSDTVSYADFEKDFPGLRIVMPSMTNYLIYGQAHVTVPVFCQFIPGLIDRHGFLDQIKQHSSAADLEALMHDMDLGHARLALMQDNPVWFAPDYLHPNEHGHHEVYKYIQKYMIELG